MSNKQNFIILNEVDKIIMYYTHVYMLDGGGSFEWNEDCNFTKSVINALNTKLKTNYTNKSMGGLIKDFNLSYSLTRSEEGDFVLTDKGLQTFYKTHIKILEFGKDNMLDQFLSNSLKDLIPNKYLN